jgi:hypothetical protein
MKPLEKSSWAHVAGGRKMEDLNHQVANSTPPANFFLGSTVWNDANLSPTAAAQLSQLSAAGWSFNYTNLASAPTNSSGTDYGHKMIAIGNNYSSNAFAALGQLFHELGHAENPTDLWGGDYSNADSYVNAAMQGEGYAQLNAFREAQQMGATGQNVLVPGTSAIVQQEAAMYHTLSSQGASDATIAAQLGNIMRNEVLANGQTYDQYYRSHWFPGMQPGPGGGAAGGNAGGMYNGSVYVGPVTWSPTPTGYVTVGPIQL